MAKFSGDSKFRFYLLIFFCFLLAAFLVGRLFFIQVREREAYSALSDRQLNSVKSKASVSLRGDIYFEEKDGNIISAATTKDGFLVAFDPRLISDSQKICETIGAIISIKQADCAAKADKKDDPFEEIAHRVDFAVADKIKNLKLAGVNVFPEEWRFEPGNFLASHVLGFVGYEGNDLVGRYGLEEYYEDVLKGKKDTLAKSDSFAATFLELGKNILSSDISQGRNLVLTIEPRVQSVLEKSLKETLAKWNAESAGGIIMDPKTGAVLAMAAKPDFDPNKYSAVANLNLFRNPLTSDLFEMGSVVKPLTLAAAMDSGKITADTTYTDNGYLIIDSARIENYDGKGRGKVSMQEVLNQSLNTGAVFVMRQLGKENFRNYFLNYGLSEKTGIDLAGETAGNLKNLDSQREIEYASASFGQGMAVTPIEFVSAISAIANQGIIMRPYIVTR
ncbi:MAG: penicillin-binding protein 2, partial [bacterium]|nr:penicillin-binding protein 2 [bacterium]